MKNFVQPGKGLTFTAPYDLSAGDTFKVGAYVGVASSDATSGDTDLEGQLEGVYSLVKHTGESWSQGDVLYWDNSNKYWTKTATSNTLAGKAAAAAQSADAVGNVHLMPGLADAALAAAIAADS